MVRLHVKKGDLSCFLYDTTISAKTDDLLLDLLEIYNGRLKIERICSEIEELVKHGTFLPPNMLGLTEDQIEDLKLVDDWGEKCVPSGGHRLNKDPMVRRNGKQPMENMVAILEKTVKEVKEAISKRLVDQGKPLTRAEVLEQLNLLRGACTIVYPMGLPPHDPIRMELEYREDLSGTQDSLQVITRDEAEMWFCGRQIFTGSGQHLKDFIKHEKTKVVVKLQNKGNGPPAREPVMSEEDRKQLMLMAYRKQEEHKKLEEDEDDNCYGSQWADKSQLKRQFQGLNDIGWKPK